VTLDEILDVLERDLARHMTDGPCSEEDLRRLETALGDPLPADLRAFLGRLGGGVFYDAHEVFGARRVMIHDIELIPDLLSLRRTLKGVPPDALPFHRSTSVVHVIELAPGGRPARITPLGGGSGYPDLAAFLESVVLPSAP
jgi:SMI1 / KNR4 family (SUKH-1)